MLTVDQVVGLLEAVNALIKSVDPDLVASVVAAASALS